MSSFERFCLLSLLVAVGVSSDDTPVWSSYYSVDGNIVIPTAKIREPFSAWYDPGTSGNSRIDYYNGTVKTYSLSKMGKFGTSVKVLPVNVKNGTNTLKCFKVNGTERLPILAQTVLPDLKFYKLIDKRIENGTEVERWGLSVTNDTIYSDFEMVLYRKDGVVYPLRFNVKGLNPLFVKHFDSYYVLYRNFSFVKPDPSIFSIEDFKCEYLPGNDVYNDFNQMAVLANEYYGKRADAAFEKIKRQYTSSDISMMAEHYYERKSKLHQKIR